ncbi:hypothetical protein A0H81_03918 [Grifola frondosa]|uniref:Uncharacterized protein n=1 Tax=Grifola frondosa TaxID=5627 RepID=A0A1C7MIP9_GRIFR|nr:hypothetical protein A0H81_03918 [Grifola frondosa]
MVDWGGKRQSRVDEENTAALAEEIEKEIGEWLQAWEETKKLRDGSVEARVALEWAAKIICTLVIEAELIHSGREKYMERYNQELLPWMSMNII